MYLPSWLYSLSDVTLVQSADYRGWMDLDESQNRAVQSPSQLLQVVAGPGTGKTLVLAARIVKLLEDGVDPSSIVAFTYTNRAKTVLIHRVNTMLGPDRIHLASELSISTYHGYCSSLVERWPADAGISSDWSLIDEFDREQILADPILKIPYGMRAKFPDSALPATVNAYKQLLRESRCYDYDELVMLGTCIVQKRDVGIKHLLIDEFQDGESELWEFIEAAMKWNPRMGITVVGDPNQEIFAFRKNHIRQAFATMVKRFSRCGEGSIEVVRLTTNYRSTPEIVAVVNDIIGNPQYSLLPSPAALPGENPRLDICTHDAQERSIILATIRDILARGYSPHDIAVIVRTNSQAVEFCNELTDASIPTVAFLNRARVLKSNLVYSLYKYAIAPNNVLLHNILCNSWAPVVKTASLSGSGCDLESRMRAGEWGNVASRRFKELIEDLLPLLAHKWATTTSLSFLVRSTQATINGWAHPSRTALEIENLPHLHSDVPVSAAEIPPFQRRTPLKFTEFLLAVSNVVQNGPLNRMEPIVPQIVSAVIDNSTPLTNKTGVHVLTLHAAKGKEWPVVFLPQGDSKSTASPWFRVNDQEERRLLYVGASRAKNSLYFSNAGAVSSSRNRFLNLKSSVGNIVAETSLPLLLRRYPRALGTIPKALNVS